MQSRTHYHLTRFSTLLVICEVDHEQGLCLYSDESVLQSVCEDWLGSGCRAESNEKGRTPIVGFEDSRSEAETAEGRGVVGRRFDIPGGG